MEDKKIILILVIFFLILIGGLSYWIIKSDFSFISQLPLSEEEEEKELSEEGKKIEKAEEEESGEKLFAKTLIKKDFTIILPPGWEEISPSPEGLAMAVDTQEEITNEKAKKINFQTYFLINSTQLGELSAEKYIEEVKISLVQKIPNIKFTDEEKGIINGRQAFFLECQSRQEEIDFKTLLVFIEGRDKTIWAISFNSLKESWSTYRDLFYQIAETFQLR